MSLVSDAMASGCFAVCILLAWQNSRSEVISVSMLFLAWLAFAVLKRTVKSAICSFHSVNCPFEYSLLGQQHPLQQRHQSMFRWQCCIRGNFVVSKQIVSMMMAKRCLSSTLQALLVINFRAGKMMHDFRWNKRRLIFFCSFSSTPVGLS